MSMPSEATEWLKNKKLRRGFHYMDVWLEEHTRAFTIAKCMDIDLLSDIRNSIVKAMEEGQTYKQWSSNITKVMKEKGWWGEKNGGPQNRRRNQSSAWQSPALENHF